MRFSQSRLEEVTDEELDFIACPECGYDESDTSRGIAMHFGYNHGGNITNLFRCDECGRLKFGHGQTNRLCSKYCEIHERVGTLKHHLEGFLREEIEEEGNSIIELSEEIDVPHKTLRKQVRKYGIGSEIECVNDGCDDMFTTRRGMSQHHEKVHGESISGTHYTCEYCGEENWTYRVNRNDPQYPKYCPSGCYGKSMEGENNPNKSEERRRKISEGVTKAYEEGRMPNKDSEWMMENVIEKRDDSYLHQEPSDETKRKLSEAQKELVESGDHVLQDEEMREQIVKTRDENDSWGWYADISPEEAQKLSQESREYYGPRTWESEITGNTLDSEWELEVDELLHSMKISYFYNEGDNLTEYNLEYGTHIPDFIIPGEDRDLVIEVKGWMGYNYDREKVDSFCKEMKQRDDIIYLVYTDQDVVGNTIVEYGNEEQLEAEVCNFLE